MAKPATRMKTILLESSSAQQHPQNVTCGREHSCSEIGTSSTSDGTSLVASAEAAYAAAHDPRSVLLAAIEERVIPGLLSAHELLREPDPAARIVCALPSAADGLELARLAARADLQGSLALALTMLGAGLTLETIFVHLIAAAARRLGSDWEADSRSFTEVTVGLGILHELVHLLVPSPALAPSSAPQLEPTPRGRALLVGSAGEQHTLGLSIFGELLRQARWTVLVELAMPPREVLSCVRSQAIDAVGLSLSSAERLPAAAELIGGIKRRARTRAIEVLVGGPVDFTREVGRMGATFCADAAEAVLWLSARFDAKSQEPPEQTFRAARNASR